MAVLIVLHFYFPMRFLSEILFRCGWSIKKISEVDFCWKTITMFHKVAVQHIPFIPNVSWRRHYVSNTKNAFLSLSLQQNDSDVKYFGPQKVSDIDIIARLKFSKIWKFSLKSMANSCLYSTVQFSQHRYIILGSSKLICCFIRGLPRVTFISTQSIRK